MSAPLDRRARGGAEGGARESVLGHDTTERRDVTLRGEMAGYVTPGVSTLSCIIS